MKVTVPHLTAGKVSHQEVGCIRVEKISGVACGCGGNFTFKRNVATAKYTYTITKKNTLGLEIGTKLEFTGSKSAKGTKMACMTELSASLGISYSEIHTSCSEYTFDISDENEYSRLYCYVDYEGTNNGTYNWEETRQMVYDPTTGGYSFVNTIHNKLGLKFTCSWGDSSHLFVTIEFDDAAKKKLGKWTITKPATVSG